MPRYRILDQHGLNYVTCTVVGWVDVFTRKNYRDILIESLAYCRKEKGLIICAYVIMSNPLAQVFPTNIQGTTLVQCLMTMHQRCGLG